MDELEKWVKDKPKVLVILSGIYVVLTETFYLLLKESNKTLNKAGLTDVPPINLWLKFYKNSSWLAEYTKELITAEILSDSSLAEWGIGLISQMYEEDTQISDILDNIKVPSEIKHYILEKVKEISPEKYSLDYRSYLDPEINETKDISIEPATLFFFRVYLPCWILYGEEPDILYRRAGQGDIKSLCNLLRLDKAIVNNQKIADIIHKASMDIESDEFRKIGNAFKGTKNITSKKKLKARIAALIASVFSKAGFQLNAPEIQALFDSVYKSINEDAIIDPDLPLSPHTFYQSIRKYTSFWKD